MGEHAPFAALLKRYRVAAGLTQEELADRANLSVRGISNLERGVRHLPQHATIELLAEALHLTGADRALFEAAARGREDAAPSRVPPTTLPAPLTSFIGRQHEVARVAAIMRRPAVFLLTLTGPGGIGKTRLALAVVAALRDDFADGVFFVSLAMIPTPDMVASAIAETLGVTGDDESSLGIALREHLREKQVLLVLDSFERTLEAAPGVAELLKACPRVKALVTSQAVLNVYGEHTYVVPPLAVPDPTCLPPLEALAEYEAVALFIERARAAKTDFTLTSDTALAVAKICHRLDGLPLALELAAAWSRLFPPQALLTRLSSRLELLTAGARDVPTRHQTLRGTLDWSYSLLDEAERTVFRRLAVFAGGCTLEAAEAVCAALATLRRDTLARVASLVEKSLLWQEEGNTGEPRFTMLDTIREYALEHLMASDEFQTLRRQHASYFLAMAAAAELALAGPWQTGWLARLAQERENLRLALQWARETGEAHGGVGAAKVLWRLGLLALTQSDAGKPGAALLQESAPGDSRRRVGGPRGMIASLNNQGVLARRQGDLERAAKLHEQSLAVARALGDTTSMLTSLDHLALVVCEQGDYTRTAALYAESLTLFQAAGERLGVASCLEGLARLGFALGKAHRAAQLFGAAEAVRTAHGGLLPLLARTTYDRDVAAVHNVLGDEVFTAAWVEGHAALLEQVIADALDDAAPA